MGYLSNNELTVDAILTKAGRAKLAKGQPLGITKFALADDEIDYTLYEPAHPLGSAYYDYSIKSTPVIEASPDQTQCMRYKLFTSTVTDLSRVPQISVPGFEAITNTWVYNIGPLPAATPYTPSTDGSRTLETYTITLGDSTLGTITSNKSATLAVTSQTSFGTAGVPVVLVTQETDSTITYTPNVSLSVGTYTTTLTITGNDTGATLSIPITLTINAA